MAESPEHRFLKEAFLNVLSDFSSLRLFGVAEVQRRMFDFGCNLERDWTLPLVGQVDWGNRRGLDKDMRTLFGERDAAIRVLVLKDDMRNRLQLSEIVAAFERQGHELFTLKVFPTVADFDADRDDHRRALQRDLHERIASDILFNVVFGGITAEHVRFFAFNAARLISVRHLPQFELFGTYGTSLAVLNYLATTDFISNRATSRALEIGHSRVNEAIMVLEGAGFVARFGDKDAGWRVTLRGRVFLELLGRIRSGFEDSLWEGELGYLLSRLDCSPEDSRVLQHRPGSRDGPSVLDALFMHIEAARHRWGVDLTGEIDYCNVVPEGALGRAHESASDGGLGPAWSTVEPRRGASRAAQGSGRTAGRAGTADSLQRPEGQRQPD